MGKEHQVVQALMVYLSRMGSAGLGFLISIVVARLLGPAEFGLFSQFLVIVILVSSIAGDALIPAVIREYAQSLNAKTLLARDVLASALAFRLALGVPLAAMAWPLGEFVAVAIYADHDYVMPVRLGLLTAVGMALWSFVLTCFQASESFRLYALLTPLVNILRLGSIAAIVLLDRFALGNIFSLHLASVILAIAVGFWILRARLSGGRPSAEQMAKQFHFGKWTGSAMIFLLLQAHLAVPVVAALSGKSAAGTYAAGATLLIFIDHLSTALITVQLPAVNRLQGRAAFAAYLKRSTRLCVLVALGLSVIAFMAEPLVLLVYGAAFAGTVKVFHILLWGYLATLVTLPATLFLLGMNQPRLYTLLAIVGLVAWLSSAPLLIPDMGSAGAAWATLAARVATAVMAVILVWRCLRNDLSGQENSES